MVISGAKGGDCFRHLACRLPDARVAALTRTLEQNGMVSSVKLVSRAEAYRRLVSGLRDEGVLFPPSPRGTGFVSSAHGAKDIEQTLAAVERVLLKFYQEDQP